MCGSEGGGDVGSLNLVHLPRVDEAEDRLRERQHCPWREEFFKLIAILPRQTFGEVFARIGRAAKRGCKYTDAGLPAGLRAPLRATRPGTSALPLSEFISAEGRTCPQAPLHDSQ